MGIAQGVDERWLVRQRHKPTILYIQQGQKMIRKIISIIAWIVNFPQGISGKAKDIKPKAKGDKEDGTS